MERVFVPNFATIIACRCRAGLFAGVVALFVLSLLTMSRPAVASEAQRTMLERVQRDAMLSTRDRRTARELLTQIDDAERADPGGKRNIDLRRLLERVAYSRSLSEQDRAAATHWAGIYDRNAARPQRMNRRPRDVSGTGPATPRNPRPVATTRRSTHVSPLPAGLAPILLVSAVTFVGLVGVFLVIRHARMASE